MDEQKVIDLRKEKFKTFLGKYWVFIVLAILLVFAWQVRTSNLSGLKDITTGDYTLGPDLDPFLFLRYAQYINAHGSLMPVDTLRYVPLGFNTADETMLLPYMIVYFYKIASVFVSGSFNYFAVIFPAFMFVLTTLAFFLLMRKIFEDKKSLGDIIALVATALLIVTPSLLPRTVAGIPEKESVGFLFLFLSFYFFLYAWKSEGRKSYILAGLAGLSTALMGLVWGGWIYIFVTLALFGFVAFMFGDIDKRKSWVYTIWILIAVIFPTLFSKRITLGDLIHSSTVELSLMVLLLILVDWLIFKTKVKESKIVKKLQTKMPDKVISIIAFILVGIILSSLLFGINFVPNSAKDVINQLTAPYTDRLSFTVAENRQPYFTEWLSSFGPVVKNIPMIFWLFFVGSIFLCHEVFKNLDRKARYISTIAYTFFIFALIFSRYSASGVFNGENGISKFLYIGGFLVLGAAFIYIFYYHYKEKRLGELKNINWAYLFLLAFFIPGIIGARSTIRLIMALSPVAVALAGYMSVILFEKMRAQKDETFKMILTILVIIIAVMTIFSFYSNYKETLAGAKQMVPNYYTQQWQKAMAWVRNSTPTDAVFGHWWDYGYWVQSMGDRATMLDGGNYYVYWDYLMGRYGLTAQTEDEALALLYSHNVTYFLIDSTDVGKYSAFSNIGSDEKYDRYSWIGTFALNPQQTQETANQTMYYYQGGVNLDEDYTYQGKFFPQGKAGIGAMLVTMHGDQPINAEAIFASSSTDYSRIPMRYLYYNSKLYDFKTGYNGCVYAYQKFDASTGELINNGAAFFLSERNMRALWVKLYLFNDSEHFELVHSEPSLVITSLKNSGADVGDLLQVNDLFGPIKIWKVKYTGNEKVNPDYLLTDYPAEIKERRQAIL